MTAEHNIKTMERPPKTECESYQNFSEEEKKLS